MAQRVGGPLPRRGRRQPRHPGQVHHQLGRRDVRRQAVVLGHVADQLADPRAVGRRRPGRARGPSPLVEEASPSRILISVDLPAPLAPTRPVTPSGTSTVRSASAVTREPYRLVSSSVVITGTLGTLARPGPLWQRRPMSVGQPVHLPAPCLVVLVGPGASGKSTWAGSHFPADAVVSSDRLRAVAGAGPDDVTASADAFALLEDIVRMRVGRRLTTVVDTLGLDGERRAGWLALARAHGVPCVAVAFDTPAAECRARNRARTPRIPADVLTGQLRAWGSVRDRLGDEGFDRLLVAEPVRVVAEPFVRAAEAAQRQREQPTGLRFGLHLGEFVAPGGARGTREWLRTTAAAAESAGFDAIYVMDHFRQIPQVGRAWDDMLESWTTLAYLAAGTERVRLGTPGQRHQLSQRGPPGEDRGHPRRAQRWPGGLRPRPRLVRAGAPGLRLGVPLHRRPVRPARGRVAAAAAAVGSGQPALPGPGARRARDALLPEAAAGAPAGAGRWGRRAPDPAAGRALRRCGQRDGRARRRTAARRPCCAHTASRPGGTPPRSP